VRFRVEAARAVAGVSESIERGLGDFDADQRTAGVGLVARPKLQGPMTREGRSLEELDVSVKLRDVTVDHITMVGAEARVRTKDSVSADLAHENFSRQVMECGRVWHSSRWWNERIIQVRTAWFTREITAFKRDAHDRRPDKIDRLADRDAGRLNP
jgi:hypothetical protein